jgi:catechol 2,3-dioxygenase-like lactoylglutathione lyase family enzyme
MALNHLAFCTHNPELTYKFYTEAMNFSIVGIEADDSKGNKYKHVFFDAGDGSYLAYYDLGAFGARAHSDANTNITEAMGIGPAYMHVAWEAKDREGLNAIRQRWLDHGLEVMESDHHKDWMHSIYTFDPNGLMVECAYVEGNLPENDAKHAYEIFVQKKGIDEVGYEREGMKPSIIHLPNPSVEKPEYYVSITEKVMNMDLETAKTIPFIKIEQH